MAGYIGTTPVPQATQHRESFTATGGQTSFATVGYTPQFIDVYLNGVKLAPADYTATNGSDVVLASGASASDILEIVAYTPFEIASQTFTGDTTANNFAVTGTFTSQGIDDNANAVAITIDSSENVGIGTSSPSELLEVKSTGSSAAIEVSAGQASTTTGEAKIVLRSPHSSSGTTYSRSEIASLGVAGGDSDLIFRTTTQSSGPAEAMRIDSSGSVLVGKTALSDTTAGISLESNGRFKAIRNSNSGYFGRLSSDGAIVNFAKDGTTVGSIGVYESDRLYIADQSNGLQFDQTTIRPCNNTGANTDDVTTLGGSGARFKNLYLSGGVYLGGTGSDNFLNDYEHGFFTPTFGGLTTNPSGVTYDPTVGNEGYYVKVGRAVFVQINIRTDGISNVGAGGLVIQGLPFVAPNLSGQGGTGSLAVSQAKDFAGEVPDAAYVSDGLDYVTLFYRSTSDGGSAASQCSDLATTTNDNLIRVGGTYYVTV